MNRSIALTAVAVTAFICGTFLVINGSIVLPDEIVRDIVTLLLGLIAGWLGVSKPGDIKQ